MDPTANIIEQVRIASHIVQHDSQHVESGAQSLADVYRLSQFLADVYRLAELVLGLDQWIRSGGFLPKPWQRPDWLPEILQLSTPGIHAAANVDSIGEPLRALCGGDGSYGSPELVTCPKCREKLLDARIERLSNVVAELLAETVRINDRIGKATD
jgi:hypothetical protein